MAGELTPKQARFVDEYMIDLNGKQAAIRAGYSAKTAEAQASRLLSNVKVAAEVARRQAERAKGVQVTQEYVLQRLIIEAEREGEGASHSARVSAASLLGKHLGMFTERVETDNQHKVQITLRRVRQEPDDNDS